MAQRLNWLAVYTEWQMVGWTINEWKPIYIYKIGKKTKIR